MSSDDRGTKNVHTPHLGARSQKAGLDEAADSASQPEPERDPESITEVAQGNLLVVLAVALLVVLGLFALFAAFG